MEPAKPAAIVLLILAVLLIAAWGLVVWVAMSITHTLIDTLSYIVDLAQMA